MPEECTAFEECLNETIGVAAFTALRYHDDGNIEDAAALINEWTNDEGECLLTYWFDENLQAVKGELLWCNSEEGPEFTYGTVNFG